MMVHTMFCTVRSQDSKAEVTVSPWPAWTTKWNPDSKQHSGTLLHECDSFHSFGCKLSWTRTKLRSMVGFNVDLIGKFQLVLVQFGLWLESWRELHLKQGNAIKWTIFELYRECQHSTGWKWKDEEETWWASDTRKVKRKEIAGMEMEPQFSFGLLKGSLPQHLILGGWGNTNLVPTLLPHFYISKPFFHSFAYALVSLRRLRCTCFCSLFSLENRKNTER